MSLELGNSSRWKESVIVEEKLKQSAANLGLICLSTRQQSKTYTHANIDLGEELPRPVGVREGRHDKKHTVELNTAWCVGTEEV